MPHVVLLLESNVDDCLWNGLANSVEEFGLPDDDLQIGGKVHLVVYVVGDLEFPEDVLFEKFDSFVGILCLPLCEDLLLVVLIELLSELDVSASNISESLG